MPTPTPHPAAPAPDDASVEALAAGLSAVGYVPTRRAVLALAGALAHRGPGAAAILLEGPPGCGKTALAEAAAAALGAPLIACQMHAWTDADELFVGIDVAAAVAGEARRVRQDGVLAVAARAAEQHPRVVVLLDEIDKAPERAEALLLDWMQSGRVPVAPGHHLRTRSSRVLVVLTSNGQRPLGDALLRRARRVWLDPLPVGQQEEIIAAATGAPAEVVRGAWRAARRIGGDALSVQEGIRLVAELRHASSVDDVREALAGWAARTPGQRDAALRCADAAGVWGEVLAARRGGGWR